MIMRLTKIIFTITSFLIFISCSDEYDDSSLKSQISDLTTKSTQLEQTISQLQSLISGLTSSNTELSNLLNTANTALSSANSDIDDIESTLDFYQNALSAIDYSSVRNLTATGNISDQTSEQAQQTLYGRWNIGLASPSRSNRSGCSFDFIEFSGDNYIMSINLPEGDKGTLFGDYVLNESSNDETIESVDLMFNIDNTSIRVARLTNIVVTENGDDISATFDVNLTLPEALEICEASLPGSVNTTKSEPVEAAETSNALSNHAKLIGEWVLTDYTSSDGMTLQDFKNEFCLDYDDQGNEISIDNCTPPTGFFVTFSDFGTYSLAVMSGDNVLGVEVGAWYWGNDSQTNLIMVMDGEEESHNIVSIDESQVTLTYSYTDYEHSTDANGNVTESPVQITDTIIVTKL